MDILAVCLLIITTIMHPIVAGLKCYECSNLVYERCGLEWTFRDGEAGPYLQECKQNHTTCQKIVGEIQGNGDQYVYRKCWKQTTNEAYTPSGCEEQYITGIIICHCSRDACNGSDVIHSKFYFILVLSLICLFSG